jgi:tRNA (cytidine32/guanosine34-2'-O)-methyltransferase
LLQLDDIYALFEGVERIIDLCAAPGSWSQVCEKKLREKGLFKEKGSPRVIAIDLQEMAPIENVTQLVGDITKKKTVD